MNIKFLRIEIKTQNCLQGFKVILGWKELLENEELREKYEIQIETLEEATEESFGNEYPFYLNDEVPDKVNTQFKVFS